MLLCRAKSARTPEVLCHLPDGSYLSRLDGLDARIIEADVMKCARPKRSPRNRRSAGLLATGVTRKSSKEILGGGVGSAQRCS
jgi:hypothetical protein